MFYHIYAKNIKWNSLNTTTQTLNCFIMTHICVDIRPSQYFLETLEVALFGTEAMQPRRQTYGPPRMFNKMGPRFGEIKQFLPNLVNPSPPLPNLVPPSPHNVWFWWKAHLM